MENPNLSGVSNRALVTVSTAAIAMAVVLFGPGFLGPLAHAADQSGVRTEAGQTATIAPAVAVSSAEFQTHVETAAELSAAEAHMAFRDAAWAARKEPSSRTRRRAAAVEASTMSGPEEPAPEAPETYTNFLHTVVDPVRAQTDPGDPGPFYSNIAEPAVGGGGRAWFLTWNHGAARTPDGGRTWIYMSPFTGWGSYSFCCDQDVVYDRGRDMIMWYRQGNYLASTGQNVFKLSVSLNGGESWLIYTIQPSGVNGAWTNQWFDYPHLALSNNYLYITTNMFDAAGNFLRMLLMRWPLDSLEAGAGFSYNYWTRTVGWSWAPVQGARETMYLGDTTNSAGTFTVFWQNEADAILSSADRAVPAWTFTNRDGHCTVANGTNPCLRADQRITAGVVSQNGSAGALTNARITFFWNVKEGGSFPFPYVDAASVDESTKNYVARPLIWNSGFAFHWASASPNERGDIGGAVYAFFPTLEPLAWAFLDDQYTGEPPGWPTFAIAGSAGGPSANSWGDYSRVRPDYPCGTTWVASVYTKNASNVSEPRFVRFGRVRDSGCFARWYRQ